MKRIITSAVLACLAALHTPINAAAQFCDNPILFVTQVPNPQGFATLVSTFGNHRAAMDQAPRGGDLWIRYPNGTLKNLTSSAGLGDSGQQGESAIAVRDPAVHFSGEKALFSMVIGAPTAQYQVKTFNWQIYEITGLGQNDTPEITKIPNQPSSYNNVSPIYASDGSIIFTSDRSRNGSTLLYPQLDEYESTPTNTGIWKLNPSTGNLVLLDHTPSGAFNPILDSYGRIIYTRWDHLQRDQQGDGEDNSYGAFNYLSEQSTKTEARTEVFPEPRSAYQASLEGTSDSLDLHSFNIFLPWQLNQDGTGHETLNHIGRHELIDYLGKSFQGDPNVEEYYGQYNVTNMDHRLSNDSFHQIRESLSVNGRYFGINAAEFGTHAAGQIVRIDGSPSLNADEMTLVYVTHPDTAFSSDSPSSNHSGLYRDPLQCANGNLIAAHTSETKMDSNIGTSSAPKSRYSFRIKALSTSGDYKVAGTSVTSGLTKTISWWSPDIATSYSGNLWELQPVEVVARTKPESTKSSLPQIESDIFSSLGVSVSEFRNYLLENDLALLSGRDVTTGDDNDHQQPRNRKLAGTNKKTIAGAGKVYSISDLQFFIGNQVRGYEGLSSSGRRILAQKFNLPDSNISNSKGPKGSVKISSDGSWAAFVPAKRALTWQLTAPDGSGVIRERVWLTFAPGEIRVCGSCHGVNDRD
ncbi:MAG: PD40 domain-containing protein, partial [Bdellovibrionales bacterium]|nr:PD40 domain-containing protein [Bdellovibrionales bacterium]